MHALIIHFSIVKTFIEGLLYKPGSKKGPGGEYDAIVAFMELLIVLGARMGRQAHNQIITHRAQCTWGP